MRYPPLKHINIFLKKKSIILLVTNLSTYTVISNICGNTLPFVKNFYGHVKHICPMYQLFQKPKPPVFLSFPMFANSPYGLWPVHALSCLNFTRACTSRQSQYGGGHNTSLAALSSPLAKGELKLFYSLDFLPRCARSKAIWSVWDIRKNLNKP